MTTSITATFYRKALNPKDFCLYALHQKLSMRTCFFPTCMLGMAILLLSVAVKAAGAELEDTESTAEFLLRNAPPELIYKGTLAGRNLHLVVYNCAAYEIKGESKSIEAVKLFETDFYPFSSCHLPSQSITVEKAAITIRFGRLAFGAGGCCTSRGSYRTTDGIKWKNAWKVRN
ncbi:hypothetical protein ACQKPC_05180 [Pseudomonas sp. NPDC089918]|uniref:hypothetical protein n=1 Tax=Pseudomonas sp. NPDC089918 TaxID=3390654 RepID=UPI003CFFF51C